VAAAVASGLPHGFPAELRDHLVELRRQLHREPELSNAEFETTARLLRELESAGIAGARRITRTGVVVDIEGARPEPVVVVRGDIDALPLDEQAEVPFRSERANVMHACGHDVHSAIVLGVAIRAHARRSTLPGTLRIVFQPAEETEPLGGRAVVDGGHLDDVAAAIALHVDPGVPVGEIAVHRGPSMASSDLFRITARGRSAHAGWPQAGTDAIAAAAAIVQGVSRIIARDIDPRVPATINIGRIEGGRASNVVADEVRMEGVIRALDEGVRADLAGRLEDAVRHAAAAAGASGELELIRGEPVLDNHPAVIEAFVAAARRVLGDHACRRLDQPTMNSEDFAFYAATVPGAVAWLGVRNEEAGIVHPLHDPRFAVDEAAIPLGTELLLATATALLESPPAPEADQAQRSAHG
jgi:amidohydrolase